MRRLLKQRASIRWQEPLWKSIRSLTRLRRRLRTSKRFRATVLLQSFQAGALQAEALKFIGEKTAIPDKLQEAAETLAQQGKTPLLFMSEAKLAGIIAVADTIKADSPEAISELRNMGIRVIMLTGDNERTARAIGDQAGVDEVIAGVLPAAKRTLYEASKNTVRQLWSATVSMMLRLSQEQMWALP